MRHAGFLVGGRERDAWLAAMTAAVDATCADHGVDAELRARLLDYFAMAADHLRNTAG
jgi:truncated hemoglobin YjbI